MGFTFSEWQTSTRQLFGALQSRGLPTTLITGPDIGCNLSWNILAAQQDASLISVYEQHMYTDMSAIADDIDTIHTLDPNKPVMLSEVGIGDPDTSAAINSYGYGFSMLSVGVQAMRMGIASALPWCLDGFDLHKNCGMWDVANPTHVRPWFAAWTLLSRYFPAGWTILSMAEPANLAIVAAHSPISTDGAFWSFALVNHDPVHDQIVTLHVPGWGGGVFNDYVYAPGNTSADAQGIPIPITSFSTAYGGLAQSLTVTVPANSAVVLTSIASIPEKSSGTEAA